MGGGQRSRDHRRQARILAFQTLYECDVSKHSWSLCIRRILDRVSLCEKGVIFATDLVQGVMQKRDNIDKIIGVYAPAWPISQLSAIDRNVLRIAVYEVVIDRKTPARAAINEAVELAKEFGGESSPRFVNGVLGSMMESVVN